MKVFCAWCLPIETLIAERSGEGISHGICKMHMEQEWAKLDSVIAARMHLHDLLNDPCISFGLQDYIRSALGRDPIDVANELEVVAKLARVWADKALQ
jgi:hypothetical protein